MIFVWLTILLLTTLILIVKRNNITLGFLGSSILALISYLLFENFVLQLCLYVIGGIICSIVLSKLKKINGDNK